MKAIQDLLQCWLFLQWRGRLGPPPCRVKLARVQQTRFVDYPAHLSLQPPLAPEKRSSEVLHKRDFCEPHLFGTKFICFGQCDSRTVRALQEVAGKEGQ
jgi:hypothetical protein